VTGWRWRSIPVRRNSAVHAREQTARPVGTGPQACERAAVKNVRHFICLLPGAPVPPAELLVNAVPLTSRLEFQTVMAPPSLPTLLANAESSTVRLERSCTYSAPAARSG